MTTGRINQGSRFYNNRAPRPRRNSARPAQSRHGRGNARVRGDACVRAPVRPGGGPTPRAIARPRPLGSRRATDRGQMVSEYTECGARAGWLPRETRPAVHASAEHRRTRCRRSRAGRGARGGLTRDVRRCVDESRARLTDDDTRLRVTQPARPTETDTGSRPIRNGPQPRSRGKPGRDAKSVVPGLRPGDRRARRRWPAAAGMFWRRELVTCETVTGVVIGVRFLSASRANR